MNIARKENTGDLIGTLTEAKDLAAFVKICLGHISKTFGMLQRPEGFDTTTVEEFLAPLLEVYFPRLVRTDGNGWISMGSR